MLSIQQVIKTLRKLQNSSSASATTTNGSDLLKSIKHVAGVTAATNVEGTMLAAIAIPNATAAAANVPKPLMTSLGGNTKSGDEKVLSYKTNADHNESLLPEQTEQRNVSSQGGDSSISCSRYAKSASTSCCSKRNVDNSISSQLPKQQTLNHHASHNECFSLYSPLNVDGSQNLCGNVRNSTTQDSSVKAVISSSTAPCESIQKATHTRSRHHHQFYNNNQPNPQQQQQRSQRIHNFFQQQIFHHQFQQFHTQPNQNLNSKHKQTQFAMSSLAAEPLVTPTPKLQQKDDHHHQQAVSSSDDESSKTSSASKQPSSSTSGKPCFNSGLGDILQFMELIGNLKHTKRTGWVLRNVDDCESISGHMYRMSILTFLLDGTEGLNQIRCMELALVHDLAESLVGDITPFCGISKEDKKAMELKAMEDICKLIEPRGKRMMELFEEYENGESPESRFVKDLDRLDMVMQAFEYEKRDNCLLKHQEFFDSTEGKFNHPFVKKLVGEIYEQREKLARAKGATPPPKVEVPNMDDPTTYAASKTANGHHDCAVARQENNEETTKTS